MTRQRLSRMLRTESMTRIPPIDPVEHVGQLRGRDSDYAVRRRWPDEAPSLHPFGVERPAETVMPKNLDQVASGASENLKIPPLSTPPQSFLPPHTPPTHPPPHHP